MEERRALPGQGSQEPTRESLGGWQCAQAGEMLSPRKETTGLPHTERP